MILKNKTTTKVMKQRLTAFVDPVLVTRAKVRGALEGLTISEVVEKALDVYAPHIEKNSDTHLNLTFKSTPSFGKMSLESDARSHRKATQHTKPTGVPR
jgi:hypothetical protein